LREIEFPPPPLRHYPKYDPVSVRVIPDGNLLLVVGFSYFPPFREFLSPPPCVPPPAPPSFSLIAQFLSSMRNSDRLWFFFFLFTFRSPTPCLGTHASPNPPPQSATYPGDTPTAPQRDDVRSPHFLMLFSLLMRSTLPPRETDMAGPFVFYGSLPFLCLPALLAVSSMLCAPTFPILFP